MKKWLKIGTFATAVAMVALMTLGTVSAFAQGPRQGNPPAIGSTVGWPAGLGGPQNSLVAVAANLFGMDQTALVAELNTGKSIAEVAKTKNISVDQIVNAAIEVRAQSLKAAVDAKRITQAQADTLIAAMKTQVTQELTVRFTPNGIGAGTGFVDANQDGICDIWGATPRNLSQFSGRGRWSW